ncbi:MMPL family transporter [Balneolaceae bacterium ANBcel3]|nr:MMPL family transporter [Balneolaceae bacterium ANBcel3]
MSFFLKLLRPLVQLNYRYPIAVLSVSLALAIYSGYYATKLVIDTDLTSLLPDDYESVIALEKLRESVGGETPLEVAVNSPDFEANKAFAEALIPKAMELFDDRREDYFVNRYEFQRDVDILKDYAIYLATDQEIDDIIFYLEEELEEARLEANPFFIDFEDDFDDDEEAYEDDRLERFEQMYREIIPSEYPVNDDSTSLVVRFFPTGSQNDLNYIRDLFAAFEGLIAEMDVQQFHSEMVVRSGGRLERHLMEIDSIIRDVTTSFGSGITAVILLVGFYFMIKKIINYRRGYFRHVNYSFWSHLIRFPVPIIVIGVPLLISLSVTFGITYVVYGSLNTMTSVLFVILFGLGIDYGIHFYARYLEKRSRGELIRNALLKTYESTGAAIMISASTTAVALFVLVIADFRGFSEFGFISGLGIVLAYLSMLFIMPSILVLFEKYNIILINKNENVDATKTAGSSGSFPFARAIFIVGTVIVAVVLFQSHRLYFEYNFSELEPEFPRYEEFRSIRGEIDQTGRRNPAYFLADTDEEVREILTTIRAMKSANPETTILDVEALQERFPVTPGEQQFKLDKVAEIRAILEDPFLKNQESEYLDILRRASKVTEPLDINDVPEFLKNRFLTRDGEIGRFVMVYPSVGLSDGRKSIAFKNEIGVIQTESGNTYHAASTSIVAAEMLELMRKESPYMVIATFLMIFILVYAGFRSFRWTIIAMLPLLIGLSWTFGAMIILGLSFNMYNLVVLPAILGIGNDNGVHLASRYREEGRKSMSAVLKSTGQHITIGSFTTMLGFAGLLLTSHPGLNSIGVLAVVGIGLTLFSALTYLPSLVQLLENKGWIRF